MNTKTIKQKAIIPASPEKVYKALLNSKEHAAFTFSAAKISDKVGGKFKAYYGYIEGKNLKLEKGKKIVQAWKAAESKWPEGYFSEATFDLRKNESGTEIVFTHKGVPAEYYKSLSKGWKEFYWEPMKEYFKNKK
jgi:activator of HSP90 ATPase